MTTESFKKLTLDFFACISARDLAGALALMTDDVTWRIHAKPELSPVAGQFDKARLQRLFKGMLAQLDEAGLTMTVTGTVAESNRAAVEVKSSGDLKNGRKYRLRNHFLLTFREGKIASVREYLDTQHAFDVWSRP
jgi:ketosteroid isomerase-like protein